MTTVEEILASLRASRELLEQRFSLPWHPDRDASSIWRHRAVHAAARLPHGPFLETMEALLTEPSFALRGVALHLVRLRRASELANSVRNLFPGPSVHVRALAAAALATFCDTVPEPLLLTLRPDDHAEVKRAAIPGLRQMRIAEASQVLVALATRHGEDEEVRCLALDALAPERDGAAAPALAAVLAAPAEPDAVRAAAARALGRIGDAGAEAALRTALADDRPAVRAGSILGLADLAPEGILPDATRLASPSESWMVRLAVAEALGIAGTPRALAPLAPLLRDSEPRIRAAALAALARIGSESGTDAAVEGLDDPDILVRVQALSTLQTLAGRSFGFDPAEHRGHLDLRRIDAALAEARHFARSRTP